MEYSIFYFNKMIIYTLFLNVCRIMFFLLYAYSVGVHIKAILVEYIRIYIYIHILFNNSE